MNGNVADCAIDFDTVNEATDSYFLPILRGLQSTTFFSFFKVDLSQDCPFWDENFECHNEFCAVCECDGNQIPSQWLEEDKKRKLATQIAVGDARGAAYGECQVKAKEEMS